MDKKNKINIWKKPKLKVHRCNDWPDLAEERDLEDNNEIFPDEMLKNILKYNDKYIKDAKSSIKFIDKLNIPDNREVNLSNSRGCRICHHDLIEDKVHYSLIKGICDIKTIQYYLFSKHIYFRSWYIKKHIKHININKIQSLENKKINIDDVELIDMNIRQITKELNEYEKLGGVKDNNIVINLRKDLKEWMQLKSNLDVVDLQKNKTISFEELMEQMKIIKE